MRNSSNASHWHPWAVYCSSITKIHCFLTKCVALLNIPPSSPNIWPWVKQCSAIKWVNCHCCIWHERDEAGEQSERLALCLHRRASLAPLSPPPHRKTLRCYPAPWGIESDTLLTWGPIMFPRRPAQALSFLHSSSLALPWALRR